LKDAALLVFSKTPVKGKVKTRLAKTLGTEKALWIYQQLLSKTESVLEEMESEVVVFYAGGSAKEFGNRFRQFTKKRQEGNELGARMAAAFKWAFDQGHTKVIGIGTDLWTINAPLLKKAFTVLDTADTVLGPATDGGYYLLGMRNFIPAVFKNKAWGTSTVLDQTRADLKPKHLVLLEEKSDLDLPEDLTKHPELVTLMNTHFDARKN
jgi:rSAM/selenodomain-associated transferase 1